MDNNNRTTPNGGLTPENLKWLEEMIDTGAPAPEPSPEKTAEELEIEKILATDWDNITLPETSEEEIAPIQETTDTKKIILESEQPATKHRDIPKKGRPEKQKQDNLLGIPHIFATVIWLALILAIGVALGRVLWVCCADVMAFGKDDQKVTITITAEDTIDTISKKLGQRKPNG